MDHYQHRMGRFGHLYCHYRGRPRNTRKSVAHITRLIFLIQQRYLAGR